MMADRAKRLLVINPNSSQAVTAAIDLAVEPLRMAGGPEIAIDFLREGPPGVQTQEDADSVVPPLARMIRHHDADAFVIACFSDPGLHTAREAAAGRPVHGIAECGLLHALTLGDSFGIIALSPHSVRRQQRLVRQMALHDRYAGSRPADLTAAQAASDEMLDRLAEAGRALVRDCHADVVVLGCAGMAGHRRALEDRIGRPVVEPTQQAVVTAIGRLMLLNS
jgi:Asp/Glu/hydantoin racemase